MCALGCGRGGGHLDAQRGGALLERLLRRRALRSRERRLGAPRRERRRSGALLRGGGEAREALLLLRLGGGLLGGGAAQADGIFQILGAAGERAGGLLDGEVGGEMMGPDSQAVTRSWRTQQAASIQLKAPSSINNNTSTDTNTLT